MNASPTPSAPPPGVCPAVMPNLDDAYARYQVEAALPRLNPIRMSIDEIVADVLNVRLGARR